MEIRPWQLLNLLFTCSAGLCFGRRCRARSEGPKVLLSVCQWSCCSAGQVLGEEDFSSSQLELFYWKDPSAWERHLCCAPQHKAMKSQRVTPCVDLETEKGIFPPTVCCAGASQGFIPSMSTWVLYSIGAHGKISRNHMCFTPSKRKKNATKSA